MVIPSLAWKNVWRNRHRSLILIVSVIVGLWAGIFIMGFYRGAGEQRIRSEIENETSHIQLHAPGFKAEYEARRLVPDGPAIAARLRAHPEVKAVAERTLARGMLATSHGSSGVVIQGIDPRQERRVTSLASKILTGGYFDPVRSRPILVGEKLARKVKLKAGSKAVLTFPNIDGDVSSGAFRVAGIYRTSNARFDERAVFVLRPDLDSLLGIGAGIHEVAVLMRDPERVGAFASALGRGYPDVLVETWNRISPELDLIVSSIDQSLLIFMAIIMLGLGFGIVNTMLMAVLERVRELGMLMALGMKRARIFALVLAETAILVLIGAPPGMALAYFTILILGRAGIDLSLWAEGLAGLGWETVVYPRLEARYYAQVLGLVSITALLASLYPARKALKLDPAEAIRT